MNDYTVIDIETTGSEPWKHELVSVGLGVNVHRPERGRGLARMAMARPGTTLVAHTNYDLRWLMLDGAQLAEGVVYHDTKVMAWLLDGTQELTLEALAYKYLGYTPPKMIRMRAGVVCFECEDGEVVPITEAPWEEVAAYNQSDIVTEGALYEALRSELQASGQWKHFVEEEAPFSRILVEMEQIGLPFDKERAIVMLADVEERLEARRSWLEEATGAPGFNPASGDQVARFVYGETWTHPVKFAIPRLNGMAKEDKWAAVEAIKPEGVELIRVGREYAYGEMELEGMALKPPAEKRRRPWDSDEEEEPKKKRPTVAAKILNMMYGANPWIAAYVDFMKAQKLAGYLRDWIVREHDGNLHGRFDQSGTATGRLTGKQPNLQQISHEARDLFRGDLVVGDYAGLEARLAAHFSLDPVMLDVFRSGADLYGTLASNAWGGPPGKENENRALFKVVWLASQYGAKGRKLAETLAIAGMHGYTARKADALLTDLERSMPRLFEWREEVIAEAKYLGYVETLAGRRRHLPELGSAVWKSMAKAERQAVNTKVQGSAADIVRTAMLQARRAVDPLVARMCLQVHDEVLWRRGPDWEPEAFNVLVSTCEDLPWELEVPLIFEAKVAQSWADKGAELDPIYEALEGVA